MSRKANSLILDDSRKSQMRKLFIAIAFRHPTRLQDIVEVTRMLAENQAFTVNEAESIVREKAPWLIYELDDLVRLTTLEYGP
jgi:hypothetical protein